MTADIPLQVPGAMDHCRNAAKEEIVHEVMVSPGSLLATAVGSRRLGVNSTYHQTVGRIPKVLRPTAVSREGIVDGLELDAARTDVSPNLLAVQFHPERLWARYQQPLALCQSFTVACRRNRQQEV